MQSIVASSAEEGKLFRLVIAMLQAVTTFRGYSGCAAIVSPDGTTVVSAGF